MVTFASGEPSAFGAQGIIHGKASQGVQACDWRGSVGDNARRKYDMVS